MSINQNSQNVVQNQNTYANKTKQPTTPIIPQKNQGIIVAALDSVPAIEYVYALAEIIKPQNILYFNKISHNRISIFLTKKEIVDELINTNQKLIINNQSLEIRRLVSSNKRIIIGNAPPYIPHHLIENKLKEQNLTLTSPINFLNAGIKKPGFENIRLFARQVFIQDTPNLIIPDTIRINYEDLDYLIFLTDTSIRKNNDANLSQPITQKNNETEIAQKNNKQKMNEPVPTASECQNITESPNTITTTVEIHHNNDTTLTQTHKKTDIIEPFDNNFQQNSTNNTPITLTQTQINTDEITIDKMNTEEIISQEADDESSLISDASYEILPKSKGKRLKKTQLSPRKPERSESPENKISLEDMLNNIKTEIDLNQKNYILSYEQFYDFIENAQGSNDPLNLAYDYTTNIPELLKNMDKLKSKLTHRKIKTTFTHITSRIQRQLNVIS